MFQKHKFLAVAKSAARSSTDQSWEREVTVPSWGPAALESRGDPHSASQLMLPPPYEEGQHRDLSHQLSVEAQDPSTCREGEVETLPGAFLSSHGQS